MDLLPLAKTVAARVEAEATPAKVPVSVCVIDIHGNLVLQHRMKGAPVFSIEISERRPIPSRWLVCEPSTCSHWCSQASRCLR